MDMNAFEAWNLRLLEHFFSPGPIGKEVFIGTPPDVLDDIGEGLGGDAGFLEAVKAGPDWKWRRKPPTLESRLQELVDRRTSSAARALGYADPGKRNCEFMPGGRLSIPPRPTCRIWQHWHEAPPSPTWMATTRACAKT